MSRSEICLLMVRTLLLLTILSSPLPGDAGSALPC